MERSLSLKAGPELDALVHEHVMGYRALEEGGWTAPDGDFCPRVWSYSSAGAWAMIVAETLVAPYGADPWLSFALRTTTHPENGRRWHAMFRREEETAWAEGMTPEEAICLAALEAVGYRPEAKSAARPEPERAGQEVWSARPAARLARVCDEDPEEPVREPVFA